MIQDFNYHTHTKRCGHASLDEDEDYVIAAIKAGFKTLGFSDHAPYPDRSKKSDRMDYEEMEDYLSSIRYLKNKYKDQIDIKIGFEMEYLDCYKDYLDELSSKTDYLILGQHYRAADGEFDYAWDKNSHEDMLLYAELIEKGLATGKFLYLAHPDYFLASQSEFDDVCEIVSRRICKACEKANIPIEINLKMKPKRVPSSDSLQTVMYPDRRFFRIASEYKLKCIYGFDAHDKDSLLAFKAKFEKANLLLKDIKLEHINKTLI